MAIQEDRRRLLASRLHTKAVTRTPSRTWLWVLIPIVVLIPVGWLIATEYKASSSRDEAAERQSAIERFLTYAQDLKAEAIKQYNVLGVKFETCDRCHGIGVRKITTMASDGSPQATPVQCDKCDGFCVVRLGPEKDPTFCSRCNGTGIRATWDKAKCPGCGGLGKKEKFKKPAFGSSFEECRQCNGTGEQRFNLTADHDCPDCGGRGRLTTIDEALEASPYYKKCPNCDQGNNPKTYKRKTDGRVVCAVCDGLGMVPRIDDDK